MKGNFHSLIHLRQCSAQFEQLFIVGARAIRNLQTFTISSALG
jgi:hypothetical protein